MYERQEVYVSPVISCCDAAEMFDVAARQVICAGKSAGRGVEAALDQVAGFVDFEIIGDDFSACPAAGGALGHLAIRPRKALLS